MVWLNDGQMKYHWLSLPEDVFTLELFAKNSNMKSAWACCVSRACFSF